VTNGPASTRIASGSRTGAFHVPLTRRKLAIPARPPSVRLARAWVRDILNEIGREDLVTSAELGVSELVTNAIIHASPPLTVAIRGTVEHPRVEVTDATPGPLQATTVEIADEADVPTTFGRGLALVAMHSHNWGSFTTKGGDYKLVWFEPAPGMRPDADLSPIFDETDEDGVVEQTPEAGSYTVTLGNFPVPLYAAMRLYQFELRRELRLLALSDPDRYPIAGETLDAFTAALAIRPTDSTFDRADDAVGSDTVALDLECLAPPGTPAVMDRLIDVLKRCYDTFADEHLLAMRPPPELEAFQEWFYGEFMRQADGSTPQPWAGPMALPEISIS